MARLQKSQWHLEDLIAMGKPEGVSAKSGILLTRKGELDFLVDAMSFQSDPIL